MQLHPSRLNAYHYANFVIPLWVGLFIVKEEKVNYKKNITMYQLQTFYLLRN